MNPARPEPITRRRTRSTASSQPEPIEPARLSRAERRDALLDATAELVSSVEIDAVTMEAVAERAGVSRPLVYKHFANRGEMLGALYQREAAHLHAEMSAQVTGADTLEDMFRALIRGALQARANRAPALNVLRAAGVRNRELREEQRRRDRTTLRFFATRAVRDFQLDERQAKTGVAILLGAVEAVLAQWRVRPTREHAALLEDTYVALVVGGLDELARRPLG
jgi:AcrR family transcriptional regulator